MIFKSHMIVIMGFWKYATIFL